MDKDYKKLCEEYEKRFGLGEGDPCRDGYEVLVGILRQQNDFLKKFKIDASIGSEDKGKATEYKNAKDLWENIHLMIKNINSLKSELKIIEEEKNNELGGPVSPQSIASSNGTLHV